jgi:hypothetical protein
MVKMSNPNSPALIGRDGKSTVIAESVCGGELPPPAIAGRTLPDSFIFAAEPKIPLIV